MPKVTLTFNLPEEQSEYEIAQNAGKYYSAIWDLYQRLRQERKYGDDKWSDFETEFWRILNENGVEV